jgi:hypothetical protein
VINLNQNKIQLLKKEMSFYNFTTHVSKNKRIQVKFNENVQVTRFGDLEYGGDITLFINQRNILQGFVLDLIKILGGEVIVIKYNEKWIVNKELCDIDLYNLIIKLGGNNNFNGGFELHNDQEISVFLIECFKYNSFPNFLLTKEKVIITPSDHMDLFISSSNMSELNIVVNKLIDQSYSNHLEGLLVD